jgi:hypothetical protein
MSRSLAATLSIAAALSASAHAQLLSSWTAPAVDDGNPIPNFVGSWLTSATSGDSVDLALLPGTRALAADNTLRRIYSAGNSLSTFGVDGDGVLISVGQPVRIRDANGTQAESGQVASMGFANGLLFASVSQSGTRGIPAGLYSINPATAQATLLRRPDQLACPVFSGMDYNVADGFMYAVAGSSPQRIVRFDLATFTATTVADVPTSAYNGVTGVSFDGLGVGGGKVFLTHALNSAYGSVPIAVFDLASGAFIQGLPSPVGGAENRIYNSGATFVDFEVRPFFAASRPERGVQVRSVDFERGVVELFNFDRADIDLTGWLFQSFDTNEFRLTTSPTGFDGVVIERGTSVFIHFNNDAPAGDPNRLNRSALGGSFALPLDQDAYALQLYFPGTGGSVNTGDTSTIADHIQWNIPGRSAGTSETRTAAAVSVGLWSRLGDFIATAPNTARIALIDLSGDDGGAPSEYSVLAPGACAIDFNRDGIFPDNQDVIDFIVVFGGGACPSDSCNSIDFNGDGVFPDNADFIDLLDVLGGGACGG